MAQRLAASFAAARSTVQFGFVQLLVVALLASWRRQL